LQARSEADRAFVWFFARALAAHSSLEDQLPYGRALLRDILSVSRPFLLNRIHSGKVPYQTVGTHPRIRLSDRMIYER